MIIRVEADTRNAREALRRLEALRRSVSPEEGRPVTLFTRIGIQVLRWVDQNFASGGGKVGGWAPLRPLTIFGRRGGSSLPLSNRGAAGLRGSFTFKAEANQVAVGTYGELAKIARWQSEGTAPYEIEPRTKQALAFPAPPLFATSASVGFFARRVVTGKRGAAAPRATGIPRRGMTTATAIRAAGFKPPPGRGGIQSFAVVKKVHHPGLPPRRILPIAEEVSEIVQPVIQDYLAEITRRT